MTNCLLGGAFQLVCPLVFLKHTTNNLRSAGRGLNLAGKGESAAFCCVHFFGIMAGGGGFKASLNCDQADDFDRARLLASNVQQ